MIEKNIIRNDHSHDYEMVDSFTETKERSEGEFNWLTIKLTRMQKIYLSQKIFRSSSCVL